jgi:hypothetical protein
MRAAGRATDPETNADEAPSAAEEDGVVEAELRNKAWWPGQAAQILLVVSGRRAQAVARHVSPPDWVPVPHAPEALRQWKVRHGRPGPGESAHHGSSIDVLNVDELPVPVETYAAVVWLLDEVPMLNARSAQLVRDMVEANRRVVHLLAPALPIETPSTLLTALARDGRADVACHCVIDTSLARSPFWTGNPDRAMDRRVADIAIGSALLSAMAGPVREELLRIGPAGKHLLSVALGRGELDGPDPDLGLVSETSATGLVESSRSRLDVGFGVTPLLDRTLRGKARGYASLRAADPAFDPLATAVVTLAVLSDAGEEPRRPLRRRQVQLELASADGIEPNEIRRS